jgi:hypothetical protein
VLLAWVLSWFEIFVWLEKVLLWGQHIGVFNILYCLHLEKRGKRVSSKFSPWKPFIEAGGQEDKYGEGYGGSPILGQWVFAAIVEQ